MRSTEGCGQCDSPWRSPDAEGMVTCPNGHRAYTGYVAEAAYLSERLAWLQQRIEAQEPAPDPAIAKRYGVWPAAPLDGGAEAPLGKSTAGRGPQAVLLTLGAGLLVVAGLVFTAVVWKQLGAGGQVALLAAITAAVGFAAVRLVKHLPSTGEALGVVAFALAAIDAVTAPALGLLPDSWLNQTNAYPTLLCLTLSVAGVLAGERLHLRSWVWAGWLAAALAAGLAQRLVAHTLGDGHRLVSALSVGIVAVAAVALLSAPHLAVRLRASVRPLSGAGAAATAWAVIAWLSYWSDLTRPTVAGLALAVTCAAVATGLVWERSRLPLPATTGLLLTGVATGLGLAVLPGQQTYLLPVVAGAVGTLALVVVRQIATVRGALLASAAVWAMWTFVRLVVANDGHPDTGLHRRLAVLACIVAVTWFLVSAVRLGPAMGWLAALVAAAGWLLTGFGDHGLETRTLPVAGLLLLAGILWRRTESATSVTSVTWLGPAATAALVPSALAGWAAPWVSEPPTLLTETTGVALLRLVAVLLFAAAAVAAGARWRLFGLLVPGAAALVVVAGAQLWSGLSATPRWVSIALVGAALVLSGARLEWLRTQGGDVRHYLRSLH